MSTCACGHEEHGRMTMVCFVKDCPCMIRNSDPEKWKQLNADQLNETSE